MALNAIARSDRPLFGIADLIAASYGFRLLFELRRKPNPP